MINETKIQALIQKLVAEVMEEMDEMSVTGDVAGYQTPHAFGNKRKKDSVPPQWSDVEDEDDDDDELVQEATYRAYKKEAKNPKRSVNLAIKEINGKLFRIERIIDQNIKLKKESGIDNKAYWSSTKSNVNRMYERMQRIGQKIRRLGEI